MDTEPAAHTLPPLPHCDGPKLQPFSFNGPQAIEFISQLGHGAHSKVFKIKIANKFYALKVFNFIDMSEMEIITPMTNYDAMQLILDYFDPFSAECRAFGRLKDTGHEDLAIGCHGYVLLDAEHEKKLMGLPLMQFHNLSYRCFYSDDPEQRPAPIRCIVKDLGSSTPLTNKLMGQLYEQVKTFHQLGIIRLDINSGAIIDGKSADFSLARTFPHYATNPDLNPHLPADWKDVIDELTWGQCQKDFGDIDELIDFWNDYCMSDSRKLHTNPRGYDRYGQLPQNLRRSLQKPFTPVDPRLQLWQRQKRKVIGSRPLASDERASASKDQTLEPVTTPAPRATAGKTRRTKRNNKLRLPRHPSKWYHKLDMEKPYREFAGTTVEARMSGKIPIHKMRLVWDYRDGHIYPRGGAYEFALVDGVTKRVPATDWPEWGTEEKAAERELQELQSELVKHLRSENVDVNEFFSQEDKWRQLVNGANT